MLPNDRWSSQIFRLLTLACEAFERDKIARRKVETQHFTERLLAGDEDPVEFLETVLAWAHIVAEEMKADPGFAEFVSLLQDLLAEFDEQMLLLGMEVVVSLGHATDPDAFWDIDDITINMDDLL